MGQGFQTTINQMGASSIYIPSTGYGKYMCFLYFGKSSKIIIFDYNQKLPFNHYKG